MIAASTFAGKSLALFGLGGSGLATAQALVAGGARVSAWDDSPASREKAAAGGLSLFDLHDAPPPPDSHEGSKGPPETPPAVKSQHCRWGLGSLVSVLHHVGWSATGRLPSVQTQKWELSQTVQRSFPAQGYT